MFKSVSGNTRSAFTFTQTPILRYAPGGKVLSGAKVTKIFLFLILILNSSALIASVSTQIPGERTDCCIELPYGLEAHDDHVYRETEDQNIEYRGSCMWSAVSDVFSTGTDIWASFNNGLCHIDISDISNPTVISELYIPCGYKGITGTNDIIVEGDYAYIGDKDGLRIVDINGMEHVSTYPLSRAHTLFLRYPAIYVVDGTGLKVFNISNPAVPDSIGFYSIPQAVGIDVAGDYAYISDTGSMGLTILNIAVPENPVFVSNYQTPGYGNSVTFSNGYAFIADYTNGLEIVDVTTPSNPVHKSNVQTSAPAYDVKVSGNYAFVAADDVVIVDISDPDSPFIAQTYSAIGSVASAFIDADYLFSSEYSFLEILNIQQPLSTFLEGSLERPYWLQEVRIGQDIACLADMGEIYSVPGGLKIIDISDCENPFLRGEYSMNLWAMPNNLDIKYPCVYMQDYINSESTLITLDVSNPDVPQLAGEYESPAKDIFASDTLVYILDNDSLKILDLRNPSDPSLEGSLSLGGNALRICVNNGYALIAGDGESILWIVNVNDCTDPQLVTSITTACNYARDMVVQGDLLYLVCDQYFQIINVSDISNPIIECTYDGVNSATGICINNNYAYIANYNLLKFDIADPADPILLEEYPIPGCSYNVAALDDHLFVTTESSFLILRDSDLTGISSEEFMLSAGTSLLQNSPNPFNTQTTIEYQVPYITNVCIIIYDVTGRKIRTLVNESRYAGNYTAVWNGEDSYGNSVSTGVYYYRMELENGYAKTEKLLLLR